MEANTAFDPPKWTWGRNLPSTPKRKIVRDSKTHEIKYTGLSRNSNIPVPPALLLVAWEVQEQAKKQRDALKVLDQKGERKDCSYYLIVQGIRYVEACIDYQCQLWTSEQMQGIPMKLAEAVQQLHDHPVLDYKTKDDIRAPYDPRE